MSHHRSIKTLAATAAVAALTVAGYGTASAAQRPAPVPRGGITYSQSCSPRDGICTASITVTGGPAYRQQFTRIVIFDPRNEEYGVSGVSSYYAWQNGQWVATYGHGSGGAAYGTENLSENTGPNPGTGTRYVFKMSTNVMSVLPPGYTGPRPLPVPVLVEGLANR